MYGSCGASHMALVVKNTPASAEDVRDVCSIPGSAKCPREGDDNPLQFSCLENPMERSSSRAVVHRVTKSRTQLRHLSRCSLEALGKSPSFKFYCQELY